MDKINETGDWNDEIEAETEEGRGRVQSKTGSLLGPQP